MAAYITSLWAINEYTASVSSSVNAILLSNGDEFVRPIAGIDSGALVSGWSVIRLMFKETIVGVSATGNITASKFCGLCATSRSFNNIPNCFAVGVSSVDTNRVPKLLTAGTTLLSNPPSQSYVYNLVEYEHMWVTGSGFSGGGNGSSTITRYDTVITASAFSNKVIPSMCGYSWTPRCIEFYNGNNITMRMSQGDFFETYLSLTGSGPGVNMSKDFFEYTSMISHDGNTMLPVLNMFGNYLQDQSWPGQTPVFTSTTNAVSTPANQNVYGPFNNINFYWMSSDPNAKLAIRDIIVVKIK